MEKYPIISAPEVLSKQNQYSYPMPKTTIVLDIVRSIVLCHVTEKREEKVQTSVPCLCYCFLVEYLALAGLMNFLAQLSDKIHHFTVYNLMPLAFLTKLSKMH